MNARLVACGLVAALLAGAAAGAQAAPALRGSTAGAASPLPGLLLDAEKRIALGDPVPKSTTHGPVTFAEVQGAVEQAAGANYSDPTGRYVDPTTGVPWPTTRDFLKLATGRPTWLGAGASDSARIEQIRQALAAIAWRAAVPDNPARGNTALNRVASTPLGVGGSCDGLNEAIPAAEASQAASLLASAAGGTTAPGPALAVPAGAGVGVRLVSTGPAGNGPALTEVGITPYYAVIHLPQPGQPYAPGVAVDQARLLVRGRKDPNTADTQSVPATLAARSVSAGWRLGTADWDWGAAGRPLGTTAPFPGELVPGSLKLASLSVPTALVDSPGSTPEHPRLAPAVAVQIRSTEPPPGWPPSAGDLKVNFCSWHRSVSASLTLIYHLAFEPASCPAGRLETQATSGLDSLGYDLEERRFLAGYEAAVAVALRRAEATRSPAALELKGVDKALKALLQARTLSSASEGGKPLADVAINDACDRGLKALRDHLGSFLEAQKVPAGKKAQIEQLADNLLVLNRLLDSRETDIVNANDKRKILQDALAGLVGVTSGDLKKGELTGEALKLFELLNGQFGEKEQTETFRASVKKLAKKVLPKGADELAGKLFILSDILSGNLTDEKRDEVLKQEIVGLFSRLAGKDLLKLPQIQAVIAGYEIAAPFAKQIDAVGETVILRSLYQECLDAGASVDAAGKTVTIPADKAFTGYTCTPYVDPDLHRIVWQVIGKPSYLKGFLPNFLSYPSVYILDPQFPGAVLGSTR